MYVYVNIYVCGYVGNIPVHVCVDVCVVYMQDRRSPAFVFSRQPDACANLYYLGAGMHWLSLDADAYAALLL